MAETTDDERLLSLLEPAADPTLPEGYRREKGLFGMGALMQPVAETVMVKQKSKHVLVETAASKARRESWANTYEPRLIQGDAKAAEIWEAQSLALHQEQERVRIANAPKVSPSPESKGKRPAEHEIRIVRI